MPPHIWIYRGNGDLLALWLGAQSLIDLGPHRLFSKQGDLMVLFYFVIKFKYVQKYGSNLKKCPKMNLIYC